MAIQQFKNVPEFEGEELYRIQDSTRGYFLYLFALPTGEMKIVEYKEYWTHDTPEIINFNDWTAFTLFVDSDLWHKFDLNEVIAIYNKRTDYLRTQVGIINKITEL